MLLKMVLFHSFNSWVIFRYVYIHQNFFQIELFFFKEQFRSQINLKSHVPGFCNFCTVAFWSGWFFGTGAGGWRAAVLCNVGCVMTAWNEKWNSVAQSRLTLCNPMDGSPPGSSVYRIHQARILDWIAISFSRGSSQPRDWTWVGFNVSCIAGRFFTIWATGKP